MKKLIVSVAAVAFIGIGGSAVSAQTPTVPFPGGPRPVDPVCAEWNGTDPIPEVYKKFYIEEAVSPPPPAVTTTTVPVTVPPGQLPRTGSGVSPILGIGALLLVGGGIVVVATRRRSTSSSPT
jgi:LPXTG-motif cell wall-anchored protein